MVNSCMFWCIVNVTVHVVVRKEDVKVFPSWSLVITSETKLLCSVNSCNCTLVVSMSDDWIVLYVEGCRGSSTESVVYVGVHEE